MTDVVKPFTFTNGPGNLIDADEVNANFDRLYDRINDLDTVNLSPTAGILGSQLAAATIGKREIGTLPRARMSRAASQSPASGNPLTFVGPEDYDTDSIIDLTVSTSKLVCRTAGFYRIEIGALWGGSSEVKVILRLNNAVDLASGSLPVMSDARLTFSTEYPLAVNDYIEAVVQHGGVGFTNSHLGMSWQGA